MSDLVSEPGPVLIWILYRAYPVPDLDHVSDSDPVSASDPQSDPDSEKRFRWNNQAKKFRICLFPNPDADETGSAFI
jgi:hypothetical protein